MTDAAALLSDLVAIDSVNPDLVPGGAGEREIAGYVADWLGRHGVETELAEPAPGRFSVFGKVPGMGRGRSLVLNAHLDTVGVAGMQNPHNPSIERGRLYGRGAYDMKAGLTACMMTAAAAVRREWRGDLIVTAVCDEEYGSLGTSSFLAGNSPDAAIVTESTGLNVCIAHKGFAWIDIQTEGVAAHGSRPDLGVDAITHMAKVLLDLNHLERRLRETSPHPLLGCASLHASLIEGGQELSSYPQRCRAQIERRTLPGESRAQVDAEIQSVLDSLTTAEPGFRATGRTTFVRDPFEVDANETIVGILRRHASIRRGREVAFVDSTAWMDAALFGAAGVPAVVFGPGGDGAHAVVEWADLDDVERCHEILLATSEEFCE